MDDDAKAFPHPKHLHGDLAEALATNLLMNRLERKLRRQAQHLIHLPKQALGALKLVVDCVGERVQVLRLSPQVGQARKDRLTFPLDDSAGLRREMRNAHSDDCMDRAGRVRLDSSPARSRGFGVRALRTLIRLSNAGTLILVKTW